MTNFEHARRQMVECQLRPNGVTNYNVINAFLSIPREDFVSKAQRPLAYIDRSFLISQGDESRFLSDAMSMAKLIQLARITLDCIVLDIGCGTGYSTAILSTLCKSVVAIESDSELAERAKHILMKRGFNNTAVVKAPLEAGLATEGPYDIIFIGGGVEQIPDTLKDQLKEKGRLVAVIGFGNSGVARLYKKSMGIVSQRDAFNCSMNPLPGFKKRTRFLF
ncbi:protein-L-isoaspartate O-methyltransferase [Candidatus Endowatersipora endosymbiont of Watersipora subatra]|uniref:protein-L-isoaspartate O-methyltransferase family protein n=1 Tax=Candidatus Endowatersipora endosymbiont of Watersipora subatra TaxID=3077946 RepID=UPI00312C7E04